MHVKLHSGLPHDAAIGGVPDEGLLIMQVQYKQSPPIRLAEAVGFEPTAPISRTLQFSGLLA